MANNNINLQNAKDLRDDEFYTTYESIEEELAHYSSHFLGKTILCNCDDPFESNFCKYFIEAKKTQLNLHDLGQLWTYCKLCEPSEAFLLSSVGLGSLNKIMNNLHRTDLLEFGDGKKIRKMQLAKWDIGRGSLDDKTLVPKI